MPEKPPDVDHVQVPWYQNPGKALNDWQQERARKFEEQLAATPPATHPDKGHEHHLKGVEGPGAVGQWLWNNQDSPAAHVAKFPLVLLSPVVIGPAALVGHVADDVDDFVGIVKSLF